MKKNSVAPSQLTAKSEWKRFLALALVVLPIAMVLLVCSYGFIVWILQAFFLGLPK